MSRPRYQMLMPGGGERLRFLDESLLVLKTDGGALAHYEYIAAPSAKIHHNGNSSRMAGSTNHPSPSASLIKCSSVSRPGCYFGAAII